MFDNIRKYTKSITTKLFLFLIAASFALWGVGDIFSQKTDPVIAEVGGETITAQDFLKTYQRILSDLKRDTDGKITDEAALSLNIHNQTLQQMINEKIIDIEAKKLNITVPKERLKKSIINSPYFQDQLGQFSQEQFQYTLRTLGLDEKEYLNQLSKAILREEISKIFFNKRKVPSIISEIFYKVRNEERSVKTVIFSSNSYKPNKEISEEEVNVHFEKFKNNYFIPENRSFTIISLKPADIISTIDIEEKEIKNEYEYYPEKYNKPELRELFLVNLDSKEEAEKLINKIDDISNFLRIASSMTNKKIDSLNLGFVSKKDLPEELAKNVFSAQLLELNGPEETPFGWRIYLVNNIQKGEKNEYEDAKNKIIQELKINTAIDKIYELGNTFYDEIASGASITEAATSINANIEMYHNVNKDGTNAEGKIIKELPPYPELLETLFSTNINSTSDLINTIANTIFAIHVDSINKNRGMSIIEAKSQIIKDIINLESIKIAESEAKSFVKNIRNDEDFEELAKKYNLIVLDLGNVRIDGSGSEGILNNKALDNIFKLKLNETTDAIQYNEQSFTVSKVTSIDQASSVKAENLNLTNEFLSNSISEDLRNTFISKLQNKYKIKINKNTFNSLFM